VARVGRSEIAGASFDGVYGSYATPEEAARGDIPERFVQVIGVVVRGDSAVVAQLTNDRPPFEIDTAEVVLTDDGWEGMNSGNTNGGLLSSKDGTMTVVLWDQAPAFAVAGRFRCGEREQTVAVERGCAFVVFDDAIRDTARLEAWIDVAGEEHELC
jgi:hypothetical protein